MIIIVFGDRKMVYSDYAEIILAYTELLTSNNDKTNVAYTLHTLYKILLDEAYRNLPRLQSEATEEELIESYGIFHL